METIITYRRRSVTRKDIATIRGIIASHPEKSRRFISQEVCRQWDWKQPNGVLKDMVCRSLLLFLESKGFIKLPAQKLVLSTFLCEFFIFQFFEERKVLTHFSYRV